MARKAKVVSGVKFSNRDIPSYPRQSPYREIAEKLAGMGEGTCAEKLPDQKAAGNVANYLREAGFKTRIGEVDGAGWCVWNRGKR